MTLQEIRELFDIAATWTDDPVRQRAMVESYLRGFLTRKGEQA